MPLPKADRILPPQLCHLHKAGQEMPVMAEHFCPLPDTSIVRYCMEPQAAVERVREGVVSTHQPVVTIS